MLRNFFITSLRILWRNKVISSINILSLAMGITAFVLILLFVLHETSYDEFNENYDRIYRLEGDEYARLPPRIGEYVADKIPEIEKVTQLQFDAVRDLNYIPDNDSGMARSTTIRIKRADRTFTKVFTMPFVRGNPKTALSDPFTVVVSESFARKLFGDEDPMGKTIIYDNIYRKNPKYTVTGVLKDLPPSHVAIDALISQATSEIVHPHRIDKANTVWVDRNWWYGTYLLLSKDANPAVVGEKINQVLAEINHEDVLPRKFAWFHLVPMKDLYLNATATRLTYGQQGDKDMLWSFAIIGLFILVLAMINYINLTTARGTLRTKEVFVKKVMGSGNRRLQLQFVTESVFVAMLALLIALPIIQIILPHFNQLVSRDIQLSSYNQPTYWVLLIIGILVTGILSGIYPALMLTKFRSILNLRSKSGQGMQGVRFRRALLTFQFSISIVLIIGIITNLRQLQFVKNADLGLDKDHVLMVRVPLAGVENYLAYQSTFKELLLQHPGIEKVSIANSRPAEDLDKLNFELDGTPVYFERQRADPDFLSVMDMELVDGRNFLWDKQSDFTIMGENAIWIINETAARMYWDDSPVGKIYHFPREDGSTLSLEIIGVIKDVHWQSLHHKVQPTAYTWQHGTRNMYLKVSSDNLSETIASVEKEWRQVYSSQPFHYSFLDQEFDAQYRNDERTANIVGYFSGLAICIACMGLFGLSSFMAVRRTKEIGIRKVLGASARTIFIMLSREYVKWILLSAIIATPIAWFAINQWLESYAYRIELGPDAFFMAAFLVLAIGLSTVAWQARKSAVSNPVEALRYE